MCSTAGQQGLTVLSHLLRARSGRRPSPLEPASAAGRRVRIAALQHGTQASAWLSISGRSRLLAGQKAGNSQSTAGVAADKHTGFIAAMLLDCVLSSSRMRDRLKSVTFRVGEAGGYEVGPVLS